MRIVFQDKSYTLNEITTGKINQNFSTESEMQVLKLITSWRAGTKVFKFHTSGSTGPAKEISLSRKQIEYSARTTLKRLWPTGTPRSMFLCVNPIFIGGSQLIIRALIANADLIVNEPSSNPIRDLSGTIGLTSLVPLQIKTIMEETPEKLDLLDTVIIGGADLDIATQHRLLDFKHTRFFLSYGMTETASHIALKTPGSEFFEPIGDVTISLDERGCLKLRGTVTQNVWIQTNDLADIKDGAFKILGRADEVINSGGIKLNPEIIESKILVTFSSAMFAITSVPDPKLGQRMVLVTTRPILDQLRKSSLLTKLEIPKEEFLIDRIPLTKSGKIDRRMVSRIAAEKTIG